jgi:hypothetical protein
LHSQKQTLSGEVAQTPPTPTQKSMQRETIALASGETRSFTVEATSDREWINLVVLAEGATALSLEQKDLTHRTIAAIAALRIAQEHDWRAYCENRGMRWCKEMKSPFRPVVIWVLNQAKAKTGEVQGSKASMIAGTLDEYWEIERPNGMTPDGILAWLDGAGGYSTLYRKRLKRLKETKDKIAKRYGCHPKIPLREQHALPEWLKGYTGDVLIWAYSDETTNRLKYRAVCRPEDATFRHSQLDQFVSARSEYGAPAEHPRAPRAESRLDLDTNKAQSEQGAQGNKDDAAQPSADTQMEVAEAKVEVAGGFQAQPPKPEPEVIEVGEDNDNDARSFDPRHCAPFNHSDLDDSIAALAGRAGQYEPARALREERLKSGVTELVQLERAEIEEVVSSLDQTTAPEAAIKEYAAPLEVQIIVPSNQRDNAASEIGDGGIRPQAAITAVSEAVAEAKESLNPPVDSKLSFRAKEARNAIIRCCAKIKLITPSELIAMMTEGATRIERRPDLARDRLDQIVTAIKTVIPWFREFCAEGISDQLSGNDVASALVDIPPATPPEPDPAERPTPPKQCQLALPLLSSASADKGESAVAVKLDCDRPDDSGCKRPRKRYTAVGSTGIKQTKAPAATVKTAQSQRVYIESAAPQIKLPLLQISLA